MMRKMTENKKKMLKELIKQLHAGAPPQEVKERFKQFIEDATPIEISKIEQELIEEGMPREKIQRLCDIHLAVFREQLGKQKMDIPLEHPISILMEEHKIMLQLAEELEGIANKIQKATDMSHVEDKQLKLKHIAEDLQDSEKHYLREENVLFPILEKHGITEPPAIMWTEHNQIRDKKKQLRHLIEDYSAVEFQDFKGQLAEIAGSLRNLFSNHFFKENNILFPAALQVITDYEWKEIRMEFDEIGYCLYLTKD